MDLEAHRPEAGQAAGHDLPFRRRPVWYPEPIHRDPAGYAWSRQDRLSNHAHRQGGADAPDVCVRGHSGNRGSRHEGNGVVTAGGRDYGRGEPAGQVGVSVGDEGNNTVISRPGWEFLASTFPPNAWQASRTSVNPRPTPPLCRALEASTRKKG